jgi:hypothetical protein
MTPFKATKGTVFEGGFRVPAIIRWSARSAGYAQNGIFSGLSWFPTLIAAGNPDITDQLLKVSWVTRPTRTTPTATIRWTSCWARVICSPPGSILVVPSVPCVSMILSTVQQPLAGLAKTTTDMPLIYNIRQTL